jgi:uncharacterized protein
MLVHPDFGKICETLIDVDSYYWEKYEYLKNHGFFATHKLVDFRKKIDESLIKDSIIQTHQIVFEVTDLCNLNCSYCIQGNLYEGFGERNIGGLNIHSAISLLEYIIDLKYKNKENKLTISFYGGEPLLNIHFIKKIVDVAQKSASKAEVKIVFAMTTNATLVDKHIRFLVNNKFKLLISLDGNEENNSYRFFRKDEKNSFHKVINNLDMILSEYPEYFENNISFNAVLHNRNSVREIYEFIYKRYNKIPKISDLALENIKLDNKHLIDEMFRDRNKSIDEYQKEESCLIPHEELPLYHELVFFFKYYSINFYISNITALFENEEYNLPTNTCLPFSMKIYLTNRGLLLPCEKINHKYSMGKVNKNTVFDIPEITRKFNFYYEHLERTCKHCYIHRFCGLCMFQIQDLDNLDDGFVCKSFHDQEAFQNKLYRVFSFLEENPNYFSEILENVVFT